MAHTRRDFLRNSACGALSAAAFASGLKHFGGMSTAQAQGPGDYKALVCVFLFGGNDANNMVIPNDTRYATEYRDQPRARPVGTINIPQANLLPITALNELPGRQQYGLHPNFGPVNQGLHQLYTQGRLAIVANAGVMAYPLTAAEYRARPQDRPNQLFSHSNQQTQHQTTDPRELTPTGWGGRIADRFGTQSFPTVTSVAGVNIFNRGNNQSPLVIAPHPTALNQALQFLGFDASAPSTARRQAMRDLRALDTGSVLVESSDGIINNVEAILDALQSNPLFAGFPNTSLGNQFYQIAKLISLRNTLFPNGGRQIFFVSLGGFDTHTGELAQHVNLYGQMNAAMRAFYDWTARAADPVSNLVTTFTLSDFGRTFNPGGGGVGSDHAWGSHYLVMGGAVNGGNIYGTPHVSQGTIFPNLTLGGPDDVDAGTAPRGRWAPTTSIDTYGSTLARWFGVNDASIPTIFPNINRFASRYLNFI